MDFDEYKAGEYAMTDGAKCLVPSHINHVWTWKDPQLNLLLSKAGYYLGVLNTMYKYLPNADLFTHGSIFKEAVKSNEIEGTKTELEEVLGAENVNDPAFVQILNYADAAPTAFDLLKTERLSESLLLKVHAGIMGFKEKKSKYKTSQNWIGGSTKYDARFNPAPPHEVDTAMQDLIAFLLNDDLDVPDLVKIAIAHYQLETIHPFDDGNGRIGRLLIPMYLIDKGILSHPLFVSRFFSDQRRDYYDNLDRVRTKNDMNHWVKFFLVAIKTSAQNTIDVINKVNALKVECEKKVKEIYGGKTVKAFKFLHLLFKNPVVNSKRIHAEMKISTATASSLMVNFENAGILNKMTGNKRNRTFIFRDYMNILTDVNAI